MAVAPIPWRGMYPSRRQMLYGTVAAPFASGFFPAAANQMYQVGASLPGKIMNWQPFRSSKPRKSVSYKSANMGGSYGYGRRYGRRRGRKTRRKYKKRVNKSTRNYIKKVTSSAQDSSAVTWRDIDSGQISCEANQCSYNNLNFLLHTQIEDALDQGKLLDPNAGTLTEVDADLTSINGLRVKIINAHSQWTFRNNGQTPCDVKCYYVFLKRRIGTADGMSTIFEDGLENLGITTNELTDLRFDVYDSPTFKQFYKVWKVRKYRVNAGDELTLTLRRKTPFVYDPDLFDKHSASSKQHRIYQGVFLRMSGVVSHDDTTTSNVGTCNATLDFVNQTHIKFSTSAGLKLKNLVVSSNSLDAQTTPKVNIEDVAEVSETL